MTILSGRGVLVVEDDYLIGSALAELLRAHGAVVAGPFGWVEDVLGFLERPPHRPPVEVAVLDIDLHGVRSYGIADRLRMLGIPFVFTTGFDAEAVDAFYRDCPRAQKPLGGDALVETLVRLLAPDVARKALTAGSGPRPGA